MALLLVTLSMFELVLTVWLLARHKSYLRRVKLLEDGVTRMARVVRDVSSDASVDSFESDEMD